MADSGSVDELLRAVHRGESQAADQLLPIVYDELKKIASAKLSRESPDNTLQPTALVHEAWIRLMGSGDGQPARSWQNRRHFLAAAAGAMRRILVDAARRRRAAKRGGGRNRERLDIDSIVMPGPPREIEAVNDALDRLAAVDGPAAELVNLRYFAGLTQAEAAEALEISLRSADRLWAFARAWLKTELADS